MFKSHWKIEEEWIYHVLKRRKWYQFTYHQIGRYLSIEDAHNELFSILRKEGKLK